MDKPIIIQYWHTTPPQEVCELMETWQTSASEGFEYHLFDDEGALKFIQEHFDARTATAYMACAVPAMKADFFRICALLIRPGIYVDADMRRTGNGRRRFFLRDPSEPLLPLFLRLERGLLFDREGRVANGFMIIKRARDELLRAILAAAIDNIERRVSNNVYIVTGPGIATRWLKQLGPQHELFKGFEFWTEASLRPFMVMVGKLPYKQSDAHWVNAQKKTSIFVEWVTHTPNAPEQ